MALSILRYGHAYDAFKLLLLGEEDIWEGMDIEEPLKVSNIYLRWMDVLLGIVMVPFQCKDVLATTTQHLPT